MPENQTTGNNSYDAFISYSRKDVAFASRLEQVLERCRPPKELNAPRRRLHIFRDQTDFTGPEYHKALDKHLGESKRLIVVCSPNARCSRFVPDEIQRFSHLRDVQSIIPVLLSGIPNNEAQPEEQASMAFPEVLCRLMPMPLPADFREFDVKRHKINRSPYASAWFKLLADIYGISRREVEERDRKQKAKYRRIILGIISAIFTLLVTAFMFWQKAQLEGALASSRELASASIHVQDQELRVLLGVEAVQHKDTQEAEDALRTSLPAVPILLSVGHTGPIDALTFSSDGRLLASASKSMVKVWDSSTGDELMSLFTVTNSSGSFPEVLGLTFSGDGKRLALATKGGMMLWELASRTLIFNTNFEDGEPVRSFRWSPNGTLFAFSIPSQAVILDVSLLKSSLILTNESPGFRVGPIFSPNLARMATVSNESLQVWDTASAQQMSTVTCRVGDIQIVAFSRDADRLAVAGTNIVEAWDVVAGKLLSAVTNDTQEVQHILFSPNGQFLAIATTVVYRLRSRAEVIRFSHTGSWSQYGHQTIGVYAASSGREIAQLDAQSNHVTSLEFSPRTNWLAAATEAGVQLWDIGSTNLLKTLEGCDSFAFSPDGTHLAAANTNDGAIVCDLTDGTQLFTLDSQADKELRCVAFSAESERIATSSRDGRVRVWNAADGKSQFDVPVRAVDAAAFSPDGRKLAVGGLDSAMLDAASGDRLLTFSNNHAQVLSLAFSPDGKRIATGLYQFGAKIWDTASGRELKTLTNKESVFGVAFNPDGTRIVTIGPREGHLWDADSGQKPLDLPNVSEHGWGVAFSPDGKKIATENQVWDANSGAEVLKDRRGQWRINAESRPLESAFAAVRIAFSADGKLFATVVGQGATVWDANSGDEKMTFPSTNNIRGLAFSKDSKYLLTVSGDWSLSKHPVDLETLINLAKKRTSRELSKAERVKYLHEKQF